MWSVPDQRALVQQLVGSGCKPVFTLAPAPPGGDPLVGVSGTFAIVAADVDPALGVFGGPEVNPTPYLLGLGMGACCQRRLDAWRRGVWAELGFEGEPPAWVTWTPLLTSTQEHDA